MDHVFRTPSFEEFRRRSPVTFVLLIINVGVFILGYVLDNYFDISLLQEGAMNKFYVEYYHQYYRLFTAAFLHDGLLHIAFNAGFGLFIISGGFERLVGSFKFSIVYFVGILGSSLSVLFFEDYYTWTVGASGAIYAVMGSLLYITLVRQDLLSRYEIASIRNLLILNVMFTFIGSTISLTGHLGGLVTGLVISYLVIPQHRYQKDDQVYDYTNDDNDDEWWTH